MGEVINLNRVRKAKARDEQAATAAANRRAFGRTKTERQADEAERRRQEAKLDGKRFEPDE